MGQQPFDPDRARTRADIPQGLARAGGQSEQGQGTNGPLGDLAIVVEQIVGQAGYAGQGLSLASTFHRHDNRVGDVGKIQPIGTRGADPFTRPAQRFHHMQARRAKATGHQIGRQRHHRFAIAQQHQGAPARNQVRPQTLQRRRVQTQTGGFL